MLGNKLLIPYITNPIYPLYMANCWNIAFLLWDCMQNVSSKQGINNLTALGQARSHGTKMIVSVNSGSIPCLPCLKTELFTDPASYSFMVFYSYFASSRFLINLLFFLPVV